MRKNHHEKKDRLVKRVFALCLALAVICTCLVPVFATEGLSDLQVEKELPGTSEEEAAGFGEDFPAVDDGEPREVYDDSEAAGFGEEEATRPVDGGEAAGFGEDEVATRPVEGGEDNLDGGPSVKETEWGTVIEYGPSSSTGTDPEPETQWSGEDDVVEKPDDKVVVSGDEIKKLQDMVVYRFWLKELNTLDLQDITAQAQINNMTESEYLARNGEVLWNLYFIQAVPRAETIADYSSYIENPSSNRDPKGELRQFDYWYTLDEFGNRVRLNLTDPTSNILDDKTTTVNVYAAWKDGTVGSDEEEDVDHEDLVDKNPVPVDLETKASASYKDEDDNTKKVDLPVEVKNLPSAADHLSVIHMGDDDMESFYKSHSSDFEGMAPILGLKISPKNAKGEKVQLAEGEKATVTVSGLNKLPEIAAMEEEGALTADALKVLHQKDDNTVEKLDVVSYENGTLTFETSSFSPFVIALTGGYDTELLDEWAAENEVTIKVGETQPVQGYRLSSSNHRWWIESGSEHVSIASDAQLSKVTLRGLSKGTAKVVHSYTWNTNGKSYNQTFTITVEPVYAAIYFLSSPDGVPGSNDVGQWSPTTDQSGLLAEINVADATWVDGTTVGGRYIENIKSNVGSYINLWPDGITSGGTWTLKRTDTQTVVGGKTAFNYVLDSVWNKYEASVRNSVGVSNLAKTDISEIKLKAFKISRNNSDKANQWYHIDCTIDIVSDKVFAARFSVKYPGDTDYTSVDAKNYLTGSKVSNTTVVDDPNAKIKVPSTTTDKNGVIYQLKGWYPENAVGGPYEESGKQNLTGDWGEGYPPSTEELADGTVNFYAEYVPVSADLTISKTVTGLLGDQHRAFTFQIFDKNNKPVALSADNIVTSTEGLTEDDKNNVGLVNNGTDGKFTLVSGASITLKNLPSGEYKVIEDNVAGYDTSWKLGESGELHEKSVEATVNVQGAAQTIAFTNHATLKPDTGVLLDTLPYIVILAVVAGGVALLMLRKRRKEDD